MVRFMLQLLPFAAYTRSIRDIPHLAKKPPPPPTEANKTPNPIYTLGRSFAFNRRMWNGYEHRMTKGERAHGRGGTGEGGEDRTWEFYLADMHM
jgi:25S rRNA (uracil2634-N3)-methyltransferase